MNYYPYTNETERKNLEKISEPGRSLIQAMILGGENESFDRLLEPEVFMGTYRQNVI